MICFFDASALQWRTYLLTIVFITCAVSLTAQQPAHATARDLHLSIQTNRLTYSVGDSILVRLALRNVSSHTIAVPSWSATHMAQLVVYDEDGHRIKTMLPRTEAIGWGRTLMMEAGKEVDVPGQERTGRRDPTGKGLVWINLQQWGYDIRSPGQYTIVGMPLVFEPDPEHPRLLLRQDTTVRSNKAKITIQPQ